MSQTATLSDFVRTPFEGGANFCAFETELKSRSALAAASNGLWELAVTAFMLVLAPLILAALAASFVVACLRMHASDLGTEGETVTEQAPVPFPNAGGREPIKFEGRQRVLSCHTSEHLWN